jgi:tetratricopeptide (TPR) repeat protein
LGVAQVVQGSLQRQGDRLRITVRLVDAATRAQLWSEAFDGPLSDIVNLPDRITGAIVSTLYDRVESALLEKSQRKPTLAAYECVLRGIRHLRGYEPDDNQRAVELFQQAVDLDPHYGLALAYRGFADVVLHHYDDSPPEILASSREMALAAVKMAPDESRCHWLLGLVVGYAGDLQSEERHYLRALALNPNDANILATYAGLLAALGRTEEGLVRMREAMRRNPYHPEWYWVDLAIIVYIARRYEDAAEAYRQRTNPGYWVMSRLAACYAQMGRMEEARAAAAEVLRLKPDFAVMKLRRAGWSNADTAHIQEGMRKAGLPD